MISWLIYTGRLNSGIFRIFKLGEWNLKRDSFPDRSLPHLYLLLSIWSGLKVLKRFSEVLLRSQSKKSIFTCVSTERISKHKQALSCTFAEPINPKSFQSANNVLPINLTPHNLWKIDIFPRFRLFSEWNQLLLAV